ncbi:3-oxoadipate enol-lactonase [Microbispora hainanensis]|jgi:3-oxoadipate enol-lactonase|uniref:3-oxoadipate enol-lactonase n=1 Tax=Microbispora hainanensis TaxID=568844 RepID=A0ABZ1SXD8_9ACTN|nr:MULTISPECIES: 3-oxoadipate enol-lactonase [Microbispora]NJP26032.1 3-oxoadipate enol-lactonase [Microbispora sp. CL1-1]TQS12808.1 3-oxoadipate enol-lactonase [Microbispora sp. SCL1-1]
MILNHRFDGPPDAPVVVLGPSLGTTLGLWEPQLPALTSTWRVLRYDLPCHGGSRAASGFTRDLTVDDLAGGVLALLDRHGVEAAAYAGVSLGGAVGTALALRAPDRIASLVLCCTSARFGTADSWRERAALVRAEGTEPLIEATRGRWFTPGFPDAERYLDMLRGADPEGYAACCDALAVFDVRDRLGEVRAPTLVIAGADDPATPPSHAEVLAEGIPETELLVVPGAAHLATVERPDVATPAITEHLTTRWRTA